MAIVDRSYHKLLYKILRDGYRYDDPNRKGVQRLEIPSYTFKHSFKDGFPAISTKELKYNNVTTELIWFLQGNTNIKYLLDNHCHIWNKDAYNNYLKYFELGRGVVSKEDANPMNMLQFIESVKAGGGDFLSEGNLGPIYGHQWRNFNGVDQIKRLIEGLKAKPLGTEHIVNSWNAGDLPEMALPPCHYGFQVIVRPLSKNERMDTQTWKFLRSPSHEELDAQNYTKYGFELHWSQRSVDTFLGLPYNIASYATLALILEKVTGYKALGIQGDLKKVHLYDNSLDAVNEQLRNSITTHHECMADFSLDFSVNIGHYRKDGLLNNFIKALSPEDFRLRGYSSYPAINVPMLSRNE